MSWKHLQISANRIILPLSEIKEYELNHKKHWDKQIKAIEESIDRFSYLEEIVLSKNNVVIIGHWRLQAIKSMWYETLEVKQLDININDEKALRVIHNVLSTYDVEYILENVLLDKKYWIDFNLGEVDFSDIESVDCTLETIDNSIDDIDYWVKEFKWIQIPVQQQYYIELIWLLNKAKQQKINIWDLFIKILENDRLAHIKN